VGRVLWDSRIAQWTADCGDVFIDIYSLIVSVTDLFIYIFTQMTFQVIVSNQKFVKFFSTP